MKMSMRMRWPIIVAVAAVLAVVGFLVAPVFGILTHHVAKQVCLGAVRARCLLPR